MKGFTSRLSKKAPKRVPFFMHLSDDPGKGIIFRFSSPCDDHSPFDRIDPGDDPGVAFGP